MDVIDVFAGVTGASYRKISLSRAFARRKRFCKLEHYSNMMAQVIPRKKYKDVWKDFNLCEISTCSNKAHCKWVQIKLAREMDYTAARFGHVMFPENVYEPTLECAELLLQGVGKGDSPLVRSLGTCTIIELNVMQSSVVNYLYDTTWPDSLATIQTSINSAVESDPCNAALLIRLLFHDCFVQGYDVSPLLEGDGSKKDSQANN
ncbi:hypothetical protein QVD17_25256 [Tagetes erecta]|uniref:peroxidase n=1 Tax=Tagetes erecta TaxID=13708 RepID=A0AAD8NN45_TARER|nr:hypothetical protein QVD17_25256 [Tagetes erecta]